MAITLVEQRTAFEHPTLKVNVGQAMCISAQAALVELTSVTNHANRVILARQILNGQHVDSFLRAAIAANAGAANLAAVTGASDASVQSAVAAVFDNFANGS